MSSMGELTFFLGLQVKQSSEGISISQDKYVITLKSNMFLGALLLVLCIIFGYICMYLLLNDEKVCMQVNIAKYRKSGGKHEEMKRLCT